MRSVVQRVKSCSVSVHQKNIGSISKGLLVYLGVEQGDTESDMMYLADKISGLRIFEDENGKMNLSIKDTGGGVLVVSQFTLCADTRKGRRPSYNNAASPEIGHEYYTLFVEELKKTGLQVETGSFGAKMEVEYINDGPVTILLDSRKNF